MGEFFVHPPTVAALTEENWQAILNNDAAFDGQFVYAVKSTGIFCRPSCKSRPPRKENTAIFTTPEEALAARFRPCKRCWPTGQRLPDEEWISSVTDYIRQHYAAALDLHALASVTHSSPYHLHRTFKRITGLTPHEAVRQMRVEKAKAELLTTGKSMGEIAASVGIGNTAHFITLFKALTGLTPAKFRKQELQTQKERIADEESS